MRLLRLLRIATVVWRYRLDEIVVSSLKNPTLVRFVRWTTFGAPRGTRGVRLRRALEREDLFTVVLEHFLTDTADYADYVLPATTQLEHYDIHKSYGHLYVMANNAAIAPVGESLPNTEVFRRLAAAPGIDLTVFYSRPTREMREENLKKDDGWLADRIYSGVPAAMVPDDSALRMETPKKNATTNSEGAMM